MVTAYAAYNASNSLAKVSIYLIEKICIFIKMFQSWNDKYNFQWNAPKICYSKFLNYNYLCTACYQKPYQYQTIITMNNAILYSKTVVLKILWDSPLPNFMTEFSSLYEQDCVLAA